MITVLDTIAALPMSALQARSLFLWHHILGAPDLELGQTFPDATPCLRHILKPMVLVPAGCEVTPLVVPIAQTGSAFDIQTNALPGADAVFAFVAAAGLRLVASIETDVTGQPVRRLQIINAQGSPHRRAQGERYMLRYRLNRAILAAKDVVFMAQTRPLATEHGMSPAPLHVWIEVDSNQERHFIVAEDISSTRLMAPAEPNTDPAQHDLLFLASFPADAIAQLTSGRDVQDVFLFVELTGEVVDARLVGEQLFH